jgi:hypothetical protein
MFHDWGNNIITIEKADIIWTIPITKKLGAPTKCPKVLVCYDFHYGIYDKEKDLMFAIEPWLFSIGTKVIFTLIFSNTTTGFVKYKFYWLLVNQHVNLSS